MCEKIEIFAFLTNTSTQQQFLLFLNPNQQGVTEEWIWKGNTASVKSTKFPDTEISQQSRINVYFFICKFIHNLKKISTDNAE